MEVAIKVAQFPKTIHDSCHPCSRLSVFPVKSVKVYRSRPWAIYQRVASMKSIKAQSEPNPSYISVPRGALRKRSGVTALTLSLVASRRNSSQVTFHLFYKGIIIRVHVYQCFTSNRVNLPFPPLGNLSACSKHEID